MSDSGKQKNSQPIIDRHKGLAGRIIYQPRPRAESIDLVPTMVQKPRGNQKFQDLPSPTGSSPYHLRLDEVLSTEHMDEIKNAGRMTFHTVGDTGGTGYEVPQHIVEMHMEDDFDLTNPQSSPAFFYHLGDVVYLFGEADKYSKQFYRPYTHYPATIFAIPGNHDGDLNYATPENIRPKSLEAFVNNFCRNAHLITPEAADIDRDAMTQPNVYWTLETPFANIVGLYSNVPEGGELHQEQFDWFVNELSSAPNDKVLIVAVHHPAYSLDNFTSGSMTIKEILENAFNKSGRIADMVLSGHVHNYQRFTYEINGRQIPYIIAGAGGYPNLTCMQRTSGLPNPQCIQQEPDDRLEVPINLPNYNLTLENYCDNRHGFLRIEVTSNLVKVEYYTVPRPQESWNASSQRIDNFELDIKTHKIIRSTLSR
ncbi:MAG TPA: metallophosphoesterase [Nitrososphaeraceae archaeon]|jgi:predicted phosphodiesterase